MDLSNVPRALVALILFGLAIILLGGLVARLGKNAQGAVSAVV